MKFTTDAKLFTAELDTVRRIIPTKSTIPILQTVRIDVKGAGFTLTGTDLDQTLISKPLDCSFVSNPIDEPNSICVEAKKLSDLTKTLDGELSAILDGKYLMLSCGKINIKLPTNPADHFPETPDVPLAPVLTLTDDALRQMEKDCSLAVTTALSRFTLNGFKLESKGDLTKLIATDGHRLAYTSVSQGGNLDALIPTQALSEVAKMANCTVDVSVTGDRLRFDTGGRTLITNKLSGNFPNYEMVMPKENDKLASFDIATMKDAIKRAKASADKRNDKVLIHFKANEAILSTTDDDCVRTESVAIDYASDEIELGFTTTYILEYLAAVKTGKGILSIKNGNTPCEFTIEGYDYDYKYILMPLRT